MAGDYKVLYGSGNESQMMSENNIRVLHLVNNFGVGGLESVIRQMVMTPNDEMISHVCVLNKAGLFAKLVADSAVPLLHIKRAEKGKGIRDVFKEITDLVGRWNIDVLHCHDISAWFLGVAVGKKCRKKVILTKHGCMEC